MNYECVFKRSPAGEIIIHRQPCAEPEALPPGAVLVEVERAAVDASRLDRLKLSGSVVGRIRAVGESVGSIRVGDRVSSIGPLIRQLVLPAAACLPVPDGVEDEAAVYWAWLICLTRLARQLRIELGETVQMHGGGLMGHLMSRLALVAGGFVVTDEEVDVLIDVTGDYHGFERRLSQVKAGGRILVLAVNEADAIDFDFYPDIHRRSLIVVGAHLAVATQPNVSALPYAQEAEFVEFLLRTDRFNLAPTAGQSARLSGGQEQSLPVGNSLSLILSYAI